MASTLTVASPVAVLPTLQGTPIWLTWRSWESLALNLSEIPREANTYDLYRAFEKEGTISSIDIFDDRHGNRAHWGRVRFRPPPSTDFWQNGPYQVPLRSGRVAKIRLNVELGSQNMFVPSPVRQGIAYPAEIHLNAVKLDFGVLVDDFTTHPMRSFGSSANVMLSVDVRMRALIVHYQVPINSTNSLGVTETDETARFRLKVPFLQLSQIWESTDESTKDHSILMILDTPAVHHRQVKDFDVTFSGHDTIWRESDTWYRQTAIAHGYSLGSNASTSLRRLGQIIDIGRWKVIKLTFSANAVDQDTTSVIHEVLKDHNIMVQDGNHFKESTGRPVPVWRWIDFDAKTAQESPFHMLGDLADRDYVHLTFPVRYQLEVCMSHGYLSEFTMTRDFVAKLVEVGESKAQRLLEHVATSKQTYLNPMAIFDLEVVKGVTDSKIPTYCCFMRTARVTPTTIYYNTPTVDISNRITRHYIEFAERFIRIRFTDEKTQGRINSSMGSTNDEVFTRVKRTLTQGITIGDRHYEFLAFGNSQFREHGAYFFAPLPHLTAAHIRAWMGQFSHIRNVAKHAARLGQCFSTTRAVAGTPVTVTKIPDITRNGFCFSDGVGQISKFLAQMALNELKIKTPKSGYPSAFQFRLGGCKGMLTISSDAGPKEVRIRPSQFKFESEHNGLEIIRWSQFGIATLNRQIILVLSSLGIPDHVFNKKLDTMLDGFNRAMSNDSQAVELLQKFVDPNQMTVNLAQMVSDGFRRSKEPFVNSMLLLWKAWQLKGLKEKAKIVIDQGANLLGVLDETGTLKGYSDQKPSSTRFQAGAVPDLPEIFVQICRPDNSPPEIIQGICILARNPSLHPGDIRVVRAVDRPELRHLYDVVVFPQTGDRDLPSMCSGGDLDGDDYLVIWDQDLIPKQRSTPPMKYTSRKVPDLNHDVTVNEITSFFVTYMKNDCLPRIAHAHMAQADWLPDGILEKKCLRLAQLHSDAVDYNKTGGVAIMSRDLEPRKWPHFMEKKYKRQNQIYISKKILGQLYDVVEKIDFEPNLEMPFDPRILGSALAPQSEAFLDFAEHLKAEYDAAMLRIMAQFEINTEFEVYSTFVLSHNCLCRDYKIQEDLGRISSILREGFRHQCYEKIKSRLYEDVAPLVVAMYRVTHKQMESALEARRESLIEDYDDHDSFDGLDLSDVKLPLISFPWIFHDMLGKIAQGNVQVPKSRVEDKDASIQEINRKIYTQDDVKRILASFDLGEGSKDPAINVTESDAVALTSDELLSKGTDGSDFSVLTPPDQEIPQDALATPEEEDENVEEIVEVEADIKPSMVDKLLKMISE